MSPIHSDLSGFDDSNADSNYELSSQEERAEPLDDEQIAQNLTEEAKKIEQNSIEETKQLEQSSIETKKKRKTQNENRTKRKHK